MVPLTEVLIEPGAKGGVLMITDDNDPEFTVTYFLAAWKASTIGPGGIFQTEVYESQDKFERALQKQKMKERAVTLAFVSDENGDPDDKVPSPIYLPTRRLVIPSDA